MICSLTLQLPGAGECLRVDDVELLLLPGHGLRGGLHLGLEGGGQVRGEVSGGEQGRGEGEVGGRRDPLEAVPGLNMLGRLLLLLLLQLLFLQLVWKLLLLLLLMLLLLLV